MKHLLLSFMFILASFAPAFPEEPATNAQPAGEEIVSDAAKEKEKDEGRDKKKQLEEVVVTATRTERTTEEVPAAVTAVTEDNIKDTRMFGIKEALTGISGVQAESKNGGYDARLIIRGAGLKARYGVREIMVLLDGVPITDPDGMSRLDFVDTQLVERIDVVKGPNSTMYGANAAGGVINIMTRSPYEEYKVARLAYGSDNSQMYNLGYGNRIGDTYFSLSGSRRSTDSWREWNKFSTNQASLKLGHMFTEGTTLDAMFSYTRAYLQLPGSLTREQFNRDITQLTQEPWRNSVRNSDIYFTNVRMEIERGGVKIKPLVYFESWSHFHPVTGIINDGGANVYGADLQADVKHSIFGADCTLTMGVSGQADDSSGSKYTYRDFVAGPGGRLLYTTSNRKGDLAEVDDDLTTKWGVFVQESVRPADRWIVDLGVRYDQVRFDMDDKLFKEFKYGANKYVNVPLSRRFLNRSKTFDYVSPKVGAVCRLTDFLHMYGTFSTGFQTPQQSEISNNPNLNPMKVYNYETGLKARFEQGHSLDLSFFYMTLNDEVVQSLGLGGVSTYINAGKTEKYGVELSGKARLYEGLYVGGAYTYSHFTYKEFLEPVSGVLMDRRGNQLPYVPAHQYTAFLEYRHPCGLRFKVDTNTWGRYYLDNANSATYKGYSLLTNLLVGYEYKKLDITCTMNNVADARYAMEVTKDTTGKVLYKPGAPMSWMVQATYRF